MSSYLDIAKKVTVSNAQGPSSAGRECECGAAEPAGAASAEAADFSRGLGAGPHVSADMATAPVQVAPLFESIVQTPCVGDGKADREWRRFLAVAVRRRDGNGLFDPSQEPAPAGGYVVPHPDDRPAGVPRGWSVDGWRKYMLHMADACEQMHPEKAAEYRLKAEQLV